MDPTFSSGNKKDSFKIRDSGCIENCAPEFAVAGAKYYDFRLPAGTYNTANQNGVLDAGEPAIPNWEVDVSTCDAAANSNCIPANPVQTFTSNAGQWSLVFPNGTKFTACEVAPGGTGWLQTGPVPAAVNSGGGATADNNRCWTGTIGGADLNGLDFGNVFRIGGKKYLDANTNGVNDSEGGIQGVRINIGTCNTDSCIPLSGNQVVTTDANGNWSATLDYPSVNYEACEILPTGTWQQTGPLSGALAGGATALANGCWAGPFGSGAGTGLDFGNVCLGAGGAMSKGFWSNKNGQNILTSCSSYLTLLDGLNLVNGPGAAFNPTKYSDLNTWLQGATATNMAYMLSAQMATMDLSVYCAAPLAAGKFGGVSGSAFVYAGTKPSACTESIPGLNAQNFISINNLTSDANGELGAPGGNVTTGAGVQRSCEEYEKTALDRANNNLNFVQGSACPVVYPQ
jgi:hypothetical protein